MSPVIEVCNELEKNINRYVETNYKGLCTVVVKGKIDRGIIFSSEVHLEITLYFVDQCIETINIDGKTRVGDEYDYGYNQAVTKIEYIADIHALNIAKEKAKELWKRYPGLFGHITPHKRFNTYELVMSQVCLRNLTEYLDSLKDEEYYKEYKDMIFSFLKMQSFLPVFKSDNSYNFMTTAYNANDVTWKQAEITSTFPVINNLEFYENVVYTLKQARENNDKREAEAKADSDNEFLQNLISQCNGNA